MWTTAALLGHHPTSAEQAGTACALLGLEVAVAEALQQQPARGIDPGLLQDPTTYRFSEAPAVYGPASEELVHEEVGDGILSAINVTVDIARGPSGRRPRRRHPRRRVPRPPLVSAPSGPPRGRRAGGCRPLGRQRTAPATSTRGIEPAHTAVVIPDHPCSAAVPSRPVKRVTTQK